MSSASPFILDPNTAPQEAPWGGKGRALFRLTKAGFNVPEWFAISPDAYSELGVNSDLSQQIQSAARALGEQLAVRSSAGDEDGSSHSFAGQLESFLHVNPDEVPASVTKVWQSG